MSKGSIRIIALLVVMLMLTAILGACGSGGNEAVPEESTGNTTVEEQSQVATAEQEKKLDEVTLKFYFVGTKKSATDEVWDNVSAITKDTLNAKFEINYVPWGDYPDKIQLLSASGDDYDMNFDADWMIYPKVVNKGAYLPLNDLLPQYAPNLYATYQELQMIKPSSVNGKIYALPWTINKTSRPYLVYRKDLADKLGISDFSTLEDIEKFLYAAKNDGSFPEIFAWNQSEADGTIQNIMYTKYEYDRWDYHQLTMDLNDSSYKIVPLEQTEMFKETVQTAKKWRDDGIISKNLIADSSIALDRFKAGKLACYIDIYDNATSLIELEDKSGETGYAAIYPDNKHRFDSCLNNIFCINKNAANPERTLMFLEAISSNQEVYDAMMYGIEGETYVLDGKTVRFPEGIDQNTSNYLGWETQWAFWRTDRMRPDDVRDEQHWIDNNMMLSQPSNVVSPISGLIPDTESIKTEMAKRDSIFNELGKLLVYGNVTDIDKSLNEYIQKQKDAGLDKILAEVQKQVDEWVASK